MGFSRIVLSKLSRAVCASIGIVATSGIGAAVAAPADTTRVIVAFQPGAASQVRAAVAAARGQIKHEIFGMDAFAVEVPTNALNGLERNPNVEYVEEDAKRYPYSGTTPSTGSPYFAGQLVPYGIKMVQRLINYQMAMGLPATGRFALSIPAMTCSTKI